MTRINKERLENTRNVMYDAKNLVTKLEMVAGYDEVFDEDEVELIDVITKNINQYSELLEKVLEDETVDDEEIALMKEYEKTLTSKVKTQVQKDGMTSEGEQDILNVLFDCLSNLDSFGSSS